MELARRNEGRADPTPVMRGASRRRRFRQVDFPAVGPAVSRGPHRAVPGPSSRIYTGLPLNDAARLRADTWDADRISVRSRNTVLVRTLGLSIARAGPDGIWADYDRRPSGLLPFGPTGAYEKRGRLPGRPRHLLTMRHTSRAFQPGWEGTSDRLPYPSEANYCDANGVPRSGRPHLQTSTGRCTATT